MESSPYHHHRMDSPASPPIPNPDNAIKLEAPCFDGQLMQIFISSGHDYWGRHGEGRLQSGIAEVKEVECVEGMGLKGDRYFNYRRDYKGQVTFFDLRVVEEVRRLFKLPKLPASVFRRNLIVLGADLHQWKGRRFQLQGVVFEGSQECSPCHWMDRAVSPGTLEFLKENFRGGLRAKIVSSGILRTV